MVNYENTLKKVYRKRLFFHELYLEKESLEPGNFYSR